MVKSTLQFAVLIFASALASTASANQWAEQMVTTKKIDFGVIATGSEAKKYVEVKNIYNVEVYISDVTTTCGCSAAAIGERTLQPGQTSLVEVKMNTQKFRQKKDSNLIIKFGRPQLAEVRVPITAYIRTDVVFNPGSIRFGEVPVGTEGTAEVAIAYAGRPDWDIETIKIANKGLKARLSAPLRDGGNINFKLTMTLSKSAPIGPLRDLVTIVTNDRTNPYVPLMIEGTVVPEISITPATVAVQPLAPGQTAKVQVVVRGRKPFLIDDIDCEGMADCFKATLKPTAQPVHVVPIEFNAPNRPGRFSEELIVKINGRPEPLRFNVTGTITN